MIIVYDKNADSAYLYLDEESKRKVGKTIPCEPSANGPMINIDLDHNNMIIGFEILDASKFLNKEVLANTKVV